jgi:hypothetical protein
VPLTVTGGAIDTGSGVVSVSIVIRRQSDDAIVFSGPAVNTGTAYSTWSFTFIPATQAGAEYVTVIATDAAGNIVSQKSQSFLVM